MCVTGFVLWVFTCSPGRGEKHSEETPLDACQEYEVSHRQLSINIQRHRQTHTSVHTYIVYTHTCLTHSIRPSSSFSSFPFLKALLYPIQGKHQWSVAEYKTLQRETNGNHTFVLTASHGYVLLVWEIRPCLGLLAGDLWLWISFIKKRGRKDDLFFLSPFLSWSPASLPALFRCSWVIYRIRSEAFIRHIWKHARVTEWTHTDVKNTVYTNALSQLLWRRAWTKTERERPDRSKQTQYVQEYLHLYLFNTMTNLIWPQTAFNPRGVPIRCT